VAVSLDLPQPEIAKTVATAIKVRRIGSQFENRMVMNVLMLRCLLNENNWHNKS